MDSSDVKVAVIYYSSTGSVFRQAHAVAAGAEKVGAWARVRRVPELAPPEAIAANPEWLRHSAEASHVAEATLDDLRWADAIVLGTPTRFGLPSAQMKHFIDQTGGLWSRGELVNKVCASFTSGGSRHGGQEATILALNTTFYHWGAILVPPGYTGEIQHKQGNPYGNSHVSVDGAWPSDVVLLSAEHLGQRVATVAVASVALREHAA
jgi:NAD(P)H dehydrogenase (quinone)